MHIPALLNEVLEHLNPQPNQNFIDCTVGAGGHAIAILEKTAPNGKLLGIDLNQEAVVKRLVPVMGKKTMTGTSLSTRLILTQGNFRDLARIAKKYEFNNISGILLDLGLCSNLLEQSGKGFSFRKDEPLDMRFEEEGINAAEIINTWPKQEIEEILQEYGEEKFSRQIAQEIIEQRKKEPIVSTFELVDVIKKATPIWYYHRRIHPATKTFQALRIAVNQELENLRAVLPQALELLKRGGRLAVISYHSLEDRIVKNFFREQTQKGKIKIITKKPITPSQEEISQNPRSRSAKLRACERDRPYSIQKNYV